VGILVICILYSEVFPCFFLSCKANARVKLAKTGHGPHSSRLVAICVVLLLLVLFYYYLCINVYYCVCVCKCVLYYCHRVTTQLQLTNIYHITFYVQKLYPENPTIYEITWKNMAEPKGPQMII